MRISAILQVAGVSLGAATMAWLLWGAPGDPVVVHGAGPGEASHEGTWSVAELPTRRPQSETVRQMASSAEPSETERFLDDFWGDEAEAVRAQLAAAGVDLDAYGTPLPLEQIRAELPRWFTFKDWELEEKLGELVEWPEPLTAAWVQARFGLMEPPSGATLLVLSDMALAYNHELRFVGQEYMAAIERGMQREVQLNRVNLTPFVSRRGAPRPGAFFVSLRSGEGWSAAVTLVRDEHPEVADALQRLHEQIALRDAILREALLGL